MTSCDERALSEELSPGKLVSPSTILTTRAADYAAAAAFTEAAPMRDDDGQNARVHAQQSVDDM